MSAPYVKNILVRPHDLNHAGTVFGGTMMSWADELAYIAATLSHPGSTFVTRVFREFNFERGARQGDIIELAAEVVKVGRTSVTVEVKARNATTGVALFQTVAVMVNVVDGKAAPIPR